MHVRELVREVLRGGGVLDEGVGDGFGVGGGRVQGHGCGGEGVEGELAVWREAGEESGEESFVVVVSFGLPVCEPAWLQGSAPEADG